LAFSQRWLLSIGAPAQLRSDNGAEFVAQTVQLWLAQSGVATLYIEPGKPWQNGKQERFNGTVRDECLNRFVFGSLAEASVRLERFRQEPVVYLMLALLRTHHLHSLFYTLLSAALDDLPCAAIQVSRGGHRHCLGLLLTGPLPYYSAQRIPLMPCPQCIENYHQRHDVVSTDHCSRYTFVYHW
jgi:transposase InsO family protein